MSLFQAVSSMIKTLVSNVKVDTRPTYPLNPPVIQPAAPPPPKVEGTPLTFGQQYQVESTNADGKPVLRTISLTALQSTPTISAPTAVTSQKDEARAAQLLASAHLSPTQIKSALDSAKHIDFFLCIKSQPSVTVEFNNLRTPTLEAQVSYNFYTPDEKNVASQENDSLDPLLSGQPVPRAVKLTWQPTDSPGMFADFAPRTTEETKFVMSYLNPARGVATEQSSPKSNVSAKNINPITREGLSVELVDTHNIPKGFDSVSNGRIFKDSVLTVINTNVGDGENISLKDLLIDDL